jgi:hypothetical protein
MRRELEMKERGLIAISSLMYLAFAAAAAGVIFAAYMWVSNTWETRAGIKRGEKNITTKWDIAKEQQRAKDAAQAEQATKGLEVKNAKAKVVYRNITRNVDKIVERVSYRNICLDADGLRAANDAIRGAVGTTGEPDATVLTPSATDGR